MRLLLAIAGITVACSGEHGATTGPAPASSAQSARLGGDIVARVGDIPLERTLVLAVARARGISAREAVDALIGEAILAQAALHAGAPRDPAQPLARALLDRMRDEALAQGPWTDEELGRLSKEQWKELDRPEGRTVVHALVKKDVPNAAEVAKELHDKLVAATGPDAVASARAFSDAAKAFHVLVHVEELSFVADGRLLEGTGSILPSFTKGAFSIPAVLGTSDVVQTDYGFHVIRLLAIFPPKVASREERITRLRPQLIAGRARALNDALLARLQKEHSPRIVGSDQDLLLPR